MPSGRLMIVEAGEVWTAWVNTAGVRSTHAAAPRAQRVDRLEHALRAAQGAVFVGVEVRGDNLAEVLTVLARLPQGAARAAALLGRDVVRAGHDAAELEAACLEAGACLALRTPRDATRLLAVAQRWLSGYRAAENRDAPLFEQVAARLPWQPATGPLG